MKRENIICYFLQSFIILFFLGILFTSKVSFNKILIAIILLIYMYITKKVIARPKKQSIYRKEVTKYMVAFAIIYVVLYYVIGIYVGFYNSLYKFSFQTLINYILPITVIIIASEMIRNDFLSNKNKFSSASALVFSVVVDLVLYVNIYNLTNLEEFLQALGYIFFASIVSNVLYNYTSSKFGVLPNIGYRLITSLYIYIIPIVPDVYIYFKSVCRMIYPLLIYLVLRSVYEKDKQIASVNNRTLKTLSITLTIIIMTIVSALISCKFTYGMLVIGSGSMTGTIDKGDAIIYKASKDVKEVKKGDIILFSANNKIIVHRVVKIEDINDEIRIYTKGDNNVQQDAGYITKEEYKGRVKLRIAKIGQPTVWINEFFKGIKRGN